MQTMWLRRLWCLRFAYLHNTSKEGIEEIGSSQTISCAPSSKSVTSKTAIASAASLGNFYNDMLGVVEGGEEESEEGDKWLAFPLNQSRISKWSHSTWAPMTWHCSDNAHVTKIQIRPFWNTRRLAKPAMQWPKNHQWILPSKACSSFVKDNSSWSFGTSSCS